MIKRVIKWAKEMVGTGRGSGQSFINTFSRFREILALNNKVLELIAEANDKLSGDYIFDRHYIETICHEATEMVEKLIFALDELAPGKYLALHDAFNRIRNDIEDILAGRQPRSEHRLIIPYNEINRDMTQEVGGKNATIAQVGNFMGINIPDGFAATAAAFELFMKQEGLGERIAVITEQWDKNNIDAITAAEEIQPLIAETRVPSKLKREIEAAAAALKKKHHTKKIFFAVRSSAWGEDSEHSFAGQYTSILNVPYSGLIEAYKKVVASSYSASALEYRRRIGYHEDEVIMPVAFQQLVNPLCSGVLYTYDPVAPAREVMIATSTWGLGAPVVSGTAAVDEFCMERKPPHKVVESRITTKMKALVPDEKGGTRIKNIPEEKQLTSSLTQKQISELADTGLIIEKNFRKPQDIEFAFDKRGRLIILQTRQLQVKSFNAPSASDLAGIKDKYTVILEKCGTTAQDGIATGPVHIVKDDKDLKNFPAGAIMVTRFASPKLASVLHKAAAVITEVGSVTGHLATVAREYRVPAVFNCENATKILREGQEITIDAEEPAIYEGLVKELKYYALAEESIGETYEYRLLRRVLKKIEPLNLVDPTEKNFTPQACQTLHDIVRFVHEKAVQTIVDTGYYHPHDPDTAAGKLKLDVPLDLVVIDIGGGLDEDVETGRKAIIRPEQVRSVPMRALIEGITHPGAWSNEPMSVDMGSFMSSLTRTFSTEITSPQQLGQNLAVISYEYANVSLRLGYHFTMIDTYITENMNDNYAYFRFFGGVTDADRRARRARFIGAVLSYYDFRIDLHGDLVVGRIKKLDKKAMLKRIFLLGLLVGVTRQLDVRMVNEQRVIEYTELIKQLMEDGHG